MRCGSLLQESKDQQQPWKTTRQLHGNLDTNLPGGTPGGARARVAVLSLLQKHPQRTDIRVHIGARMRWLAFYRLASPTCTGSAVKIDLHAHPFLEAQWLHQPFGRAFVFQRVVTRQTPETVIFRQSRACTY